MTPSPLTSDPFQIPVHLNEEEVRLIPELDLDHRPRRVHSHHDRLAQPQIQAAARHVCTGRHQHQPPVPRGVHCPHASSALRCHHRCQYENDQNCPVPSGKLLENFSSYQHYSNPHYLKYRIANALFGMTLGGAAQHMNTEGARARDHREQALKHFEGRKAIGTLIQLVGSLLLAYLPTVILVFYETISNHVAHPLALKASLLCLSTAAPVNSFLFGIRNKSIQMILINFVRKELYKNEVQQEIRQRSPGLAGSTRPSMTSIVGQITCQVPYLQRHVSFASLMAVSLSLCFSLFDTTNSDNQASTQ